MTALPKPYLVTLTIFLLGGVFASLLMYYTALAKNLDGLYNESIFSCAAYFGLTAAIALISHHVLIWCEPKRECEE